MFGEAGQALIIVLCFIALCTILVVVFLTNVTSAGVEENAAVAETSASQLSAMAVQLVEGTITNATVSGSSVGMAWASQPGMIRTYGSGTPGGNITASSSPLAYYKLYSSNNMVVSAGDDMNPTDIFEGDVPNRWNATPALYTDLNAPIIVGNASTSGTATIFPIVDPRAADSDMAVQGFSFSTTAPSGFGSVPGVVTTGTTGTYATDKTSLSRHAGSLDVCTAGWKSHHSGCPALATPRSGRARRGN